MISIDGTLWVRVHHDIWNRLTRSSHLFVLGIQNSGPSPALAPPSLSLTLSLSLSLSLFLFPLRPRLPSVPAICPSLGIDRVRRGAERYPPGAAGLVACNLPVPGHCQCDEARGSSFPLFSALIQNSVLAMQELVQELRILLGTIIIRSPPPSAI